MRSSYSLTRFVLFEGRAGVVRWKNVFILHAFSWFSEVISVGSFAGFEKSTKIGNFERRTRGSSWKLSKSCFWRIKWRDWEIMIE